MLILVTIFSNYRQRSRELTSQRFRFLLSVAVSIPPECTAFAERYYTVAHSFLGADFALATPAKRQTIGQTVPVEPNFHAVILILSKRIELNRKIQLDGYGLLYYIVEILGFQSKPDELI